MEMWLRLMSDSMRGAADAQEAMRTLGESPATPDNLARWMARFMPAESTQSGESQLSGDWLEDTWRAMGVVPRYRYLELLERNELLRSRLEEAEKNIESLKKKLSADNVPDQEAQKILNLWENMLQETLNMQSEWMRTLAPDQEGEQVAGQKGEGKSEFPEGEKSQKESGAEKE
jgi:hypothetical protein